MILSMQMADLVLIPTEPTWSIAKSNPIEGENIYDNYLFSWSDADVITGRYEPMQFTGLHDKNGKEIWEGDVVRYSIQRTYQTNPMEVKIPDIYKDLGHDDHYYLPDEDSFEVIGNIYENPDLLK